VKAFPLVLLLCLSTARAETITAAQASSHIGQHETVCGTVAGEHFAARSKGQPTFINLDAAYPNQIFTILVWGDDRAAVGQLPATGQRVCASGHITNFRGVPEIAVRNSSQLTE
jgi:hypothetical protein